MITLISKIIGWLRGLFAIPKTMLVKAEIFVTREQLFMSISPEILRELTMKNLILQLIDEMRKEKLIDVYEIEDARMDGIRFVAKLKIVKK